MTFDEAAIEFGTTVYRIGKALYGPASVVFGDDTLTDSEVSYLRDEYFGTGNSRSEAMRERNAAYVASIASEPDYSAFRD